MHRKNIIAKTSELIGNTPLINLAHYVPHTKILIKLELYNLTGSVKDRMALYMLQKARKRGLLSSGGTIIEATTGNTGIAFSALASIFGYKMIAVMPSGQSVERVKMMESYGAKVILTPKEKGPAGAIALRDQLAKKIPNSWVPNQFSNPDNVEAQYESLGKELLNQIKGKIDYFVHGIGTGGTLMGVAKALKVKFPHINIVAVEPVESAVLSGGKPGEHNIQGIGEGFIPAIVDVKKIDKVVTVSTGQAITEAKKIALKTGLLVGFSSGANIAAIKKISKIAKKNITVLTVFADRGERYLSV